MADSDRCLYCWKVYGAHAADVDPTISYPCRGAKAKFVKAKPRPGVSPPPFTKAPVTPSAPLIHAEPFNPPSAPPPSEPAPSSPSDPVAVDFEVEIEDTEPQETTITWPRLASVFGYLDKVTAERLFRLCASWEKCKTEDRILIEMMAARLRKEK